jgi:hypothetical protein
VAVVAVALTVAAAKHRRATKARCHAEVTALREWMQQLDVEGGGGGDLPIPKAVVLVSLAERAGGGEDGPTLALDGDRVLLDGSPSGSLRAAGDATDQLRKLLADKAVLWRQMHPGKSYIPAALTVGVARDAAWSQVAALIDVAARAGATRTWFAFEGTTKLAPPPETDVSRALRKALSGEAIDPSQTARMMEERDTPIRRVYARCPEVGEELAPLAQESFDPAQKNAAFLKAIPDAVERCGCRVDMNEVEAMQWARYDRYQGTPKVFRELSIAPRGSEDAIALTGPRDEPWSQSHTRVLAASARGARVFLATE